MVAQAFDLPSESSNFSSIPSQDAAKMAFRIATPLSRANQPHGNPIPAMKISSKSSRKTSAKTHKPHKASSIVSNSDMPSSASAQRKTSKGSKSDAQRRPVSTGCSISHSTQLPECRGRQTPRSWKWANARNPPSSPPTRSRSTTSVASFFSAHSSFSESPGEASPSPSLSEVISTFRHAFDSLLDIVQVQAAHIDDLSRRLSALEIRSSATFSAEQPVQDRLCVLPDSVPCTDQRGPIHDPAPNADQRGPIPPTTCSTGVQAGFTTSTFECILDGTSATSPASSSPDTCDSSTQVRFARFPVPTSPNHVALQALADTICSIEKDESFFTTPFCKDRTFADIISHISAAWRTYPRNEKKTEQQFMDELFHPKHALCEAILWFFLNSLGFHSLSACKNYKVPPSALDIIQRYRTDETTLRTSAD